MQEDHSPPARLSRRMLVGAGLTAMAAVPFSSALATAVPSPLPRPDRPVASLTTPALLPSPTARRVFLVNPRNGEALDALYADGRVYDPAVLSQVNTLLRDRRSGETTEVAVELLDLLDDLRANLGYDGPFEVVSGYRSPASNAALRARSNAVARNSYHMYGKALDIRVGGFSARELYRAAVALEAGGVGLYQGSGFVHVDVGPVRYW